MPGGRRLIALAGLGVMLGLAGCGSGEFRAQGAVSSSGGVLGQWSARPWACVRGEEEGAGAILPGAVLALAWQNPSERYIRRDLYRRYSEDAPLRLELWGSGPVLQGRMRTLKQREWIGLDTRNCRVLRVVGQDTAAEAPRGLARLDGALEMDCQVLDSHLTSTLRFVRCAP